MVVQSIEIIMINKVIKHLEDNNISGDAMDLLDMARIFVKKSITEGCVVEIDNKIAIDEMCFFRR